MWSDKTGLIPVRDRAIFAANLMNAPMNARSRNIVRRPSREVDTLVDVYRYSTDIDLFSLLGPVNK